MSVPLVLLILGGYFGLLFLVSWLSRGRGDAATFFLANRSAPWPVVAYGMIGVAISGITFISVPGQVASTQFSYFQLVTGYVLGLLAVAFVLLPVFYRMKQVSIYAYLGERFGPRTHKTGAVFFLLAQLATAAFKLYLMASVLQLVLFDALGFPFGLTVLITLLLIWLYTYRGGIQTIIITDTLQTTFLLLAVVLSIAAICTQLDLSPAGLYDALEEKGYSHIFEWSWSSPRNFFKLMLTGFLLTVMTNGLDQSVMQKHLTCKTLWDSQKNLISLAFILIFVNFLFLYLGGALQLFAEARQLPIPAMTDNLYPELAFHHLGPLAATLFLIGIAAAAYSSADSSLTGLTTSFCVDILRFDLNKDDRPRLRQGIHLGFTLLLFVLIMAFQRINESSVLHAFIRTSGFVYGPLAGLFAFGLMSEKRVSDTWAPVVCVLCPLLAFLLDRNGEAWLGYTFGYDILVFNSLLTLLGIYLLTFIPQKNENAPA